MSINSRLSLGSEQSPRFLLSLSLSLSYSSLATPYTVRINLSACKPCNRGGRRPIAAPSSLDGRLDDDVTGAVPYVVIQVKHGPHLIGWKYKPTGEKKVAAVDRNSGRPHSPHSRQEAKWLRPMSITLYWYAMQIIRSSAVSKQPNSQLYLDETPVLVIRCCSRKKKNGQNKLIAH